MKSAIHYVHRYLGLSLFAALILTFLSAGLYFGVKASGFNPLSFSGEAAQQSTPVPVVDLKVEGMEFPDSALLGEEFCYTTRIENIGDMPGYGPAIVIALPEGMTLSGASLPGVSGTPTGTPASNFPITFQGPLTMDPLNQQPPLSGNYNYYIIPAPIGSLFNGMPGIDLKICVKIDPNMTPDVAVPVCHTPYFQFGSSALGSPPINGERNCSDLTPVPVILSKKVLAPTSNKKAPAPTNEVVTGCTAYTFQLNADIAKDVTLIDMVFMDMLPDELVFVPGSVVVKGLSIPTIPVSIVDNTNSGGGGTLTVTINDDTGVSGPNPDITVEFKAFVKNFLDKGSCDTRVITNKATLDALNGGSDPIKQQTTELPIEVEHVAIQKSASGPNADPFIVVPGNTVSYRLDFQVSQDISANISIEDLLPNGIQFDFGSAILACDSGFNGPITPGVSVDKQTGKTQLVFNIGQSPGCTSCSIAYTGKVSQSYTHLLAGNPVRAADLLVNTARIRYSIDGGAADCVEDTLGAVLVHPVGISKSIKNPKTEYLPGDLVTFVIRMDIPSGDTRSITFADYLPLPIFNVATNPPFQIKCTSSPNTNVCLSKSQSLNTSQNAIIFQFNDIETSGNPAPYVEIEFSMFVTTAPFADDLYLTNLFQAFTSNTEGQPQSQLTGVTLHVRAPKLKITKGVFSAENPKAKITPPSSNPVDGNVTGVDGGDKITFYITVKNEGGAPAYSVEITDVLSPELMFVSASPAPNIGPPPTFTVSGQSITVKYSKFPSLLPGETSVFSITAMLPQTITACQPITNTASVKWRNVYDPEVIGPPLPPFFPAVSDSAFVTTAGPVVTKTVVGTSHQHTPGNDVTIGEIVTYKVDIEIPEGTTGGVMVMDQLPAGLAIPGPYPVTITAGSSPALSLTGGSLTSVAIDAPGDKISFNFGTVTNSDLNNSVKEEISFTYSVVVLDVPDNHDGKIISNSVTVTSTRCPAITTGAPIRIVEPKLEIVKEFVPSTAAAGDKVQIKLTVTNVGSSDAFDVQIEDVLSSVFSGIGAITTPTGFSFSLNGQTVSYSSGAGVSIKPGDSETFTFEVTVKTCGQFSNLAKVTQSTTLPGTVAGERYEPVVTSNTATLIVDDKCPCVDPPQFGNLVAWWPLDESAGATIIRDIAGNNHGIPDAPNSSSIVFNPGQGKVDGSIQFNNGSINVFDSNSLDIGINGLTIDAWVKTQNIGPIVGQGIVYKFNASTYQGYSFSIGASGNLEVLIGNGTQFEYFISDYKLTAGTAWRHLAVTANRDPNSTNVKFYVDGNLVSDQTSTVVTFGDIGNDLDLSIGRGGVELDEIEIFNTVLTESEIRSIVDAGSGGKCKCPKVDLTAGKALSTGVNDNGTLLPAGSQDQDYTLTLQNGTTTIPIVLTPNPAWKTSPNAAWIGPALGSGQNTVQTFKYSININLPACDPSGLSIKGMYAADNSAYILVNNDQTQLFPTVSSTGFREFVEFEITSGLQAGLNTLTFVVRNDSGVTGLLVEITEACVRCCCPEITVKPDSIPNWTAGTPYPETVFTATGGTGPYTFSYTGALPEGMTLSADGKLTGTPMVVGSFTFIITATDSKGCSGAKVYRLVIDCGAIMLSSSGSTTGEIFKPFNLGISATGGCGQFTYSISNGQLPPGLTLDPATGAISGTPTAPGDYLIEITATDKCGCSGKLTLTIKIDCPLIDVKTQRGLFNTGVDNNSALLPANQLDGHYPVTDFVDQVSLPTTLNLGQPLPTAGWIGLKQWTIGNTYRFRMRFNLAGCEVGTIMINGQYAFVGKKAWVQVNNDPAQLFPQSAPFTLTQFSISSGLVQGENSITFVVENGDFPPGLLVEFTGARGRCCTCRERFSFTPAALADGKVSTPYPTTTIAAAGGYGTTTYAITGGALPAGMTLSADGKLTGTPTQAGVFNFTVTATDSLGCSKSRPYQLRIKIRMIDWSYEVPLPTNFTLQGDQAEQVGQIDLIVNLEALGDEHGINFSIGFDPGLLSNPVVVPGKDAGGATLVTDASQVAQGRLGISLTLPGNQTLPEGKRHISTIRFNFDSSKTGSLSTPVFGDQPVPRSISGASGNNLPTEFSQSPVLLAPVVTTVSAANYRGQPLAGEQILAAFGTSLATSTTVATELPLPTSLSGTTVSVRDSRGMDFAASLFFVSPNQVNYLMPAGPAAGQAVVTIKSSDGGISGGIVSISNIAPGLFTVDATGKGVVSSNALTLHPDNTFTQQPTAMFDSNQNKFVSIPIGLGVGEERVFLVLYGTGIRLRSSEANVRASIGGFDLPVLYAGPQGVFAGLDQINIELPRALAGLGEIDITLTVDGVVTNVVRINIE